MPDLSLLVWAVAIGVTLFAGLVKGAIGFAMPLIMVSGMTVVMPPQRAVAGILFPIVVSNLMQTFRTGLAPAREALRAFRVYIVVVCVAILLFAQIVPSLSPSLFSLILGVPVVLLSGLQLLGITLRLPEAQRWWADWVAGLVSGALGGLAGTWGPTTVLYLMALDTPKARQIVAQGVIYGLGSATLVVAHVNSGILNRETAPFTALLLVPALLGMWIGFRIHDRLDQALFRKITLAILLIAGLNLVRKGIAGL